MAFWGLVLEPKKKYTQTVEQPFHVSMATIDLPNSDPNEEASSVVLRRDGSDFILCNLSRKHKLLNAPLNLDFEVGGEIDFHVSGSSSIHLTGYVIEEDGMEGFDSDLSGEEEEEEDEAESKEALLKNTKKLLDAADKKRKADKQAQNKTKKAKVDEVDDEDDESEDDSDFAMEEEDDDGEEAEEEESSDDGEDVEEIMKQLQEQKKQKDMKKKQQQPPKEKGNQNNVQEKKPQDPKQNGTAGPASNKRYTKEGVMIQDIRPGNATAPVAKPGKMVGVYYVGRLQSNNKQFDASTSGPGFKFRLGKGEVIKGWDIGVQGMRVGEKRRLTLPPKLAYGSKGAPPSIPPNSTLVFDVELRSVS